MTPFDTWLQRATRSLAPESAARVRAEMEDHYHSALAAGASPNAALTALGDPRNANRQYRKIMLTWAEAKYLRAMSNETRALCRRPNLKNALIAAPIVVLAFSSAAYFGHAPFLARVLFALALTLGVTLTVPFFPIYTAQRSSIYRIAKWISMVGALLIAAGPQWLVFSGFAFPLYQEFFNASLRRKLPVAQWPKALYL
jgi:uncharacterized membrane protein